MENAVADQQQKKRSLVQKIKGWFGFGGAEGGHRPMMGQGELGGWYPVDRMDNRFQANLTTGDSGRVASVYAAVMLTARAVSQCRPAHIIKQSGRATPASGTVPADILRRPNQYETFNQLILNTTAEMLFEGESIWYCPRDGAEQITEAHRIPAGTWSIYVDPETRTIFYGITRGQNDLSAAPDYMIPARYIAHFRQHCPRHPLIGESPVKAAALAVGINVALSRSQLAFFSQMNRPSGVLTTDKNLTADQIKQLRKLFEEQAKDINQGGMPILSMGLNFSPLGVTQSDSQLIEQQRLSTTEIARVYGVPMALLAESGGTQGGTEALIQHWLSVGLGSVIESIERTLDALFMLPDGESIQLDPAPLLRANLEARISALTAAVQGGVMTVNEARETESLGPVEGGDRTFLQRQMTPVDLLLQIANNEAQPRPASSAPATDDLVEASFNADVFRAGIIEMREKKRAVYEH